LLELRDLELRIRPSPPYDGWAKALKLMGYSMVGLDISEGEASEFQRDIGERVKCFLRGPAASLPWVDACGFADATKRRRPPFLLIVGMTNPVGEIDSYLGTHPNRVEALELSLAEVRKAYESNPAKTFWWTSSLARVASARGMPVLVSSSATSPEELSTPLTKEAFGVILHTGRRSTRVRERRFLGRLEQVVSTRRRAGTD
jgi:hypothetical protein